MENTALQLAPQQNLVSYDKEQINLIKQTVAKGATDMELKLFLHQCARTGLDPLARQIHAIKRWDAASQRETMAIQTGIDGLRLIADRTGKYAPGDIEIIGAGPEMVAVASVKKLVAGEWHEVKATAYLSEYTQTKKDGTPTVMWKKLPKMMLGKCAEALALRRAFPAEMSGIYAHEEMLQAEQEESTPRSKTPTQQPQPEPQAKSKAAAPQEPAQPTAETGNRDKITEPQIKLIMAKMKPIHDKERCRNLMKEVFGIEHLADMPRDAVNTALEWLSEQVAEQNAGVAQ